MEDSDKYWLPTRLIDIGPAFSQYKARLIISAQMSPAERRGPVNYLALSHIWGKSQFTKLTTSNFQDLQERISPSDLSQTFQDAIIVARRLGVRYLWIDSLCIVQDSPEDWQIESSKMNLVYKNSLCTIAASEAMEPHDGLFKTRDTISFTPFNMIFILEDRSESYYCFYDQWPEVCEKKPLNQRGWVVQERLLSPRTIHFATPVFWECRELIACETYPNGLDWRRMAATRKIWSTVLTKQETWNVVVDTFSAKALTRSEDKLVAISGVAKALQPVFQDEYLAGLWRKQILPGLLWAVEKDPTGKDRDAVRVVPYRGSSSAI
jgi:hypothetical protein